MNDENKYQEYKNRQRDWRNIAVAQFSTVNNILLTFSSGLLIFLLKTPVNLCHYQNWLFWLSVLFLIVSIAYGLGVLFSRLYDARISRHIALTRKRYHAEWNKEDNNDKTKTQSLPYGSFRKFNICDRFGTFFQLFKKKGIPYIKPEKIDNRENIENDFDKLREIAAILGNASWRWTKIQIIWLLSSGILFIVFSFINSVF